MIERVIKPSETLSRQQLISALIAEYTGSSYRSKKAFGALGGAVTQKFLLYNRFTDTYTRIKK